MKIVAGLGNPGGKYSLSRHNVGFRVVDLLAEELKTSFAREKFRGLLAEANYAGEKIWLLKPLTYMNLSGECVAAAVNYMNLDADELLVVVDDVNLPLGLLRFRASGSAGGHNGLKSIIQLMGSEAFPRLRIGVGRAGLGGDLTGFVLGSFDSDERPVVEQVATKAVDAVLCFLERGLPRAMTEFNGPAGGESGEK